MTGVELYCPGAGRAQPRLLPAAAPRGSGPPPPPGGRQNTDPAPGAGHLQTVPRQGDEEQPKYQKHAIVGINNRKRIHLCRPSNFQKTIQPDISS